MKEPKWARPGTLDGDGNAECAVCGKKQSTHWPECIYCCEHRVLDFDEEWRGSDDDGSWELVVYACRRCGKNFDFSREILRRDYEVRLKEEPK